MAAARVDRAAQLVELLAAAEIPATHDAAAVAAGAPLVLVGPPTLTFDTGGGPTLSWRLLAIASTDLALDAWTQLDDLVDRVAGVLPIERAEPTAYAGRPDESPKPAYALTYVGH